jgi:hypothetical protein
LVILFKKFRKASEMLGRLSHKCISDTKIV